MPHHGAPFFEPRHAELLAAARSLAMKDLADADVAAEKDLEASSRKTVTVMGRAGILRHVVPASLGGASERVEVRSIAAAREGIAYASGLADAMLALQGLGALPIVFAGTPEQQAAWLPKLVKGEAIAGFSISEPEAGSDVASMSTRADAAQGAWQLNGTKMFTSNAGLASFYTLFAKTDPAAGSKGISCFHVPADAKGLVVEPLHPIAPHPIGILRLKDLRIPKDSLVGAPGEGYRLAMRTLDLMRPTVAAAAIGLAQRALDEAVRFARERKQFGHPIGENQGLRWRFAEAATRLEAARQVVYRAAWLKDQGQERITVEGAQAKYIATETAQSVIDLAVQVHGGRGVLSGSVPERLYREIRALRIYEGTSEILLDIIGRELLAAPPAEHTVRA